MFTGKIMIQRSLSDPGGVDDVLDTGGLESVQVNFLKGCKKDFTPGILGWILVPAKPPAALIFVLCL